MFADYKVVDILNANSVGRLLVIVDKTTKNEEYQRTITVRKEKAGWKVLDYQRQARLRGLAGGCRDRKKKK